MGKMENEFIMNDAKNISFIYHTTTQFKKKITFPFHVDIDLSVDVVVVVLVVT